MVDFHTHILPYTDDGSKSIDDTIELLKESVNAGFNKIILTSHYMEGYFTSNVEEREMKLSQLSNVIKELNLDLKLYLGNEIYITPNIVDLIVEKKACTINNSKYFLFELPFESIPLDLHDIILSIQKKGLIPILAHPERYTSMYENTEILSELHEQGVLMQSNIGSFAGQYGERAKIMANKLLECNMISFLGTDVHRKQSIYLDVKNILNSLSKKFGMEKVRKLTEINPNLVLENKNIEYEEADSIKWKFSEKRIMKKKAL